LKTKFSIWWVVAFAAAFFAVGAPYWRVPYQDVELPITILTPELLVLTVAAALLRLLGRVHFIIATTVAALGAPAAVMARVVVDTAQDPTSHNLWPFEVVAAWMVGVFAAAVGAVIASIIGRASRHGVQRNA
jgi:hypothetical protein